MPGPLYGSRQTLLLLAIKTGLGCRLDLAVHVYEPLQGFYVFVVKVLWGVLFKSSGHKIFLRKI